MRRERGIIQGVFFDQWIVVDAKANALGLAFSNGGKALIGDL